MSSLYLAEQTNSARIENQNLVIVSRDENQNERTTRVLLRDVSRVVVSGNPHISVPVLKALCRQKIPLALVSSRGRWVGELSGVVSNNAARRIAQYRAATAGESLALAFAVPLLFAKISNQRSVIRRLANRNALAEKCAPALARLKALRVMLQSADALATLRGIEGFASAEYFACLAGFFPEDVPFVERSRRPPKNAANAVLSFAYAVFLAEVEFALRLHGLDPAIGFLHALEPGRASLALDLLEPFRPSVDAFALSLFNRKILTPADFWFCPDDCGTYLDKKAHAKFFLHYEKFVTRRFAFGENAVQMNLRSVVDWQVCRCLHALSEEKVQPVFFRIP